MGNASVCGNETAMPIAPGGWNDSVAQFPMRSGSWQPGDRPFVLLDDARGDASSRLFDDPCEVIIAHSPEEVVAALDTIRAGVRKGHHAAGYLTYEAGFAFEPRLAKLFREPGELPILWFGLFKQPHLVPSTAFNRYHDVLPLELVSVIDKAHYTGTVRNILELIAAGDCYQINFTMESVFEKTGPPESVFGSLRQRQRAGWGGMLSTGNAGLVSCSPELFFSLDNRTVWTKPMKGTAPRGTSPQDDLNEKARLQNSTKERAENLMIVDLLRNDLGRVSLPGSVRVAELFEIETYPTLHQMTSSICAQLKPELDAFDIIKCLFPCGSITGAPKIRAMEIIAEAEQRTRGAYTGSMGFIAPDGRAAFNVMIRTLEYCSSRGQPRFGVGSGIVADSSPELEWLECQFKSRFLTSHAAPGVGLAGHLARFS